MREKNCYELLDIAPGAGMDEIEEAYRRAKATYGEGSVAAYSLYSDEERRAMLEMINEAYETLSRNAVGKNINNAGLSGQRENVIYKAEDTFRMSADKPKDEAPVAAMPVKLIRMKGLVASMNEADPITSEQYRILYTKLDHISQKNSYKSYIITSAVKGEGKTVTSINLSYLIAREFKKKVVLVECDMRNPSFSPYFADDTGQFGLADVLNGVIDYRTALRQVEGSSLYVIPAINITRNSSELLSQPNMRTLIDRLKTEFDYVIMDSTPILNVADMNILSKLADALILVVRAGKTPKDIVSKAIDSMHNANVIGIVLNSAELSTNRYYY